MAESPSITEPKLEPCRCGRKALIERFHDDDDPQPLFVATCEVCPVKTYDQFSMEEAARIWNEFVSAPIVAPEVDDAGGAEVARFTAEDMYSALDDYCDCTTDENENQEVRAAITSFLSWFEENTHEPTNEELEEYYKSIAAPYGGAL